jgi:GNAT superfamily N-acetyltransferase
MVSSAHAQLDSPGVRILEATTKRDRDQFITFPERLYQDNPYWVPPLRFERREFLDPRKNPFFEHADVKLFLAVDAGGTVRGRIAGIVNFNHISTHNEKVGFFGLFECENTPGTARLLFDAAAAFLRSHGMDTMRGPENMCVNDDIGLLTDGFDSPPSIMMPYNPPYYIDLVTAYGFAPAMKLFAYWVEDEGEDTAEEVMQGVERIGRGAEMAQKRYGYIVRPASRRRFKEDVEKIHYAYSEAWKDNWGAVAMTEHEFAHLASALKLVADLDLCFIAEVEGEVAGFSLALPDFNQALIKIGGRLFPFGIFKLLWYKRTITALRILTMGVVKKYRGMGIDTCFYHETIKRGRAKGYRALEMSWILERNLPMNLVLQKGGARIAKTYQLYDYRL